MTALRALAIMGSLAGGITKGMESNEREAREKRRDEQADQLRQMQIDKVQQEASDDQALRGAGANVAIQDGNAGPMPEGQQYRGAGQGFASMEQVQGAEAALNSPEAKTARRQSVLQEINPMQGLQEEEFAMRTKSLRSTYMKQVESEGVKDFLDVNFATAPTVEDIEAGKAGAFALSGIEGFNKVGKLKIPEGAQGKWQTLDLGNGRKVADFTVLDKDGKPLTSMSGRTLEAIYGMSVKEREALADQRHAAGQKAKLDDREFASMDGYRKAMAEAARSRAERTSLGGSGSAYARMPEAEKVKLVGIKNRIDAINDAITQARAVNDFNDSSANGKALRAELAGLIDQQDAIVSRYTPGNAATPIPGLTVKSTADLRQSDPPTQMADLQARLFKSIQARDAAPRGSFEWNRAHSDVESLNSELKRASASIAQATASQSPSMAQAMAPRSVREVSTQIQATEDLARQAAAAERRRLLMREQAAGKGPAAVADMASAFKYLNR